jgi:hypothetical protein
VPVYDLCWRHGRLVGSGADGVVACWTVDASAAAGSSARTIVTHPHPHTSAHAATAAAAAAQTPGRCHVDQRVMGARALAHDRIASVTAHARALWDLSRPAQPLSLWPVCRL